MDKRAIVLGLIWLASCGAEPIPQGPAESAPMLQLGCQFEWVEQSAVAQAEGQYRRVQFTYLGEGEETPKRFTADVLTFAPGAVRAELLDQPDLQQYETVPEAAQKRGAIAAVNGGYYGEEFEPIGLYILNGQSLQPMSNASGLLSGVVNIDATGQVNLETRANFSSSRAVSALQSGPFLVDPGNVLGIYSDNNKLRKRSVVALSEQRELIILTTSPVSLYTLAQCLHTQAAGVGVVSIERALNLDGGISTGMFALLSNQALAKTEEVAVRTILMFYAE